MPTPDLWLPPSAVPNPKTLSELLALSPEEMARVDVARKNLLCSTGLPGAQHLDIDGCLAKIDEWTERVEFVTRRHLYRATDVRFATHYQCSERHVKAEFLLQVLQEDCGVHYNMVRVRNIDFRKSKDLFIHGLVDDPNGGTCASMPVLYLAIGRRLAYPLSLVKAKAHLFVRWEDGVERFNIEGTQGFTSHPDEFYKTWPFPVSDQEVKAHRFLVSLSSLEELAEFLMGRGHCLLDNGRALEAYEAYTIAHKLGPEDAEHFAWMMAAEARLRPPPPGRPRRPWAPIGAYAMPAPGPPRAGQTPTGLVHQPTPALGPSSLAMPGPLAASPNPPHVVGPALPGPGGPGFLRHSVPQLWARAAGMPGPAIVPATGQPIPGHPAPPQLPKRS